MNDKQQIQSNEQDAAEPRSLTANEVADVAGGPQVINDWPTLVNPDDLSAISGGPQVVNDLPT
ncbi:hypothetical protein [Roseateles sp.]|uniref:hypothetical protein n=1 Tax=Roseateles sp. TaxID=1971397 RepID=UPI0031CF9518